MIICGRIEGHASINELFLFFFFPAVLKVIFLTSLIANFSLLAGFFLFVKVS